MGVAQIQVIRKFHQNVEKTNRQTIRIKTIAIAILCFSAFFVLKKDFSYPLDRNIKMCVDLIGTKDMGLFVWACHLTARSFSYLCKLMKRATYYQASNNYIF